MQGSPDPAVGLFQYHHSQSYEGNYILGSNFLSCTKVSCFFPFCLFLFLRERGLNTLVIKLTIALIHLFNMS